MMSAMKILMKYIMSFLILGICLISCDHSAVHKVQENRDDVRFVLSFPEYSGRSSMPVSEDAVKELMIMVYHEGILVTERYFTAFSSMEIALTRGEEYSLYAVANVGKVHPPVNEELMSDLSFEIPFPMSAVPMSWSESLVISEEDDVVPVVLERLTAKIQLRVDCQVPGLEVKAVSLEQAPACVRPFYPGGNRISQEETLTGDHATDEDVDMLNAGGCVSFHMLENMQGILLEGNDDSMNRIPENLSDASGACSYLKVECSFRTGSDKEGDVVYKMYLGKDNAADFNVERNTIINVVLTLTPQGLEIKDSWKIDSDYIQHALSVVLDEDEIDIVTGCSADLNAMVYPDDACDKGVEWISSDTSVATVDRNGKVSASGEGCCVVRAISSDREEIYDECVVTVIPVAPVRVEVKASDTLVPLGETVNVEYRVHYNDSTATPFIPYGYASLKACSSEGWNVSDYNVAEISTYGVLSPKMMGTTEVIMTVGWWQDDVYRTCTGTCVVTVTAAYVVGLKVYAPAMFYEGSGGPGLCGLMSDGTETDLVADEWVTSVVGVSYSESAGIVFSDEETLIPGETICTFTAYYKDMSASADMLYGKWVKAIRCVKTSDAGLGKYRYRIALVYDDFTEEFVPFVYQAEVNEPVGVITGHASKDGVVLDWTVGSLKFDTQNRYHDYMGVPKIWSTQIK